MINIETFFYIKNAEIDFVIFDREKKKILFSKKVNIKLDHTSTADPMIEINSILKNLIIEVESEVSQSINQINILIENPLSFKINASIKKTMDKSSISKDQIEYLVQDLKQQISKNNNFININHILIDEIFVDGEKLHYLPLNKVCNSLVINVGFICFPKDFIISLKNLFTNYQIFFSSILCAQYAKSFINHNFNNIFEAAISLKNGYNSNEVLIKSKKHLKMGFFEKLFHIFS